MLCLKVNFINIETHNRLGSLQTTKSSFMFKLTILNGGSGDDIDDDDDGDDDNDNNVNDNDDACHGKYI